MKDIRIYDASMKLIHILARFKSSHWTLDWRGGGNIQVHFCISDFTSDGYALARKLSCGSAFFIRQGDLWGIVTGFQLNEEAVIYAKTLNYLLTWRVIPAHANSDSETAARPFDTVARGIISDCYGGLINVGNAVEISPSVSFANDRPRSGDAVFNELATACGVGYNVRYDGTGFVYESIVPRETRLCVSREYRNFSNDYFDFDNKSLYTCGYYRDDTDGNWKTVAPNEALSPLERRETVLEAVSADAAATELATMKPYGKSGGKTRNLCYGTDYALGDIVTVRATYAGIVAPATRYVITGTSLWWETGNTGEEPIMEEYDNE